MTRKQVITHAAIWTAASLLFAWAAIDLILNRPLEAVQSAPQAPTSTAPAIPASISCATREIVIDRLKNQYGETRRSIGLGANNGVIETFANEETGTWTIIVTTPNGMSCLVASGQAFETLAEAPGDDA